MQYNNSSWLNINRTMIGDYCNLKLPVQYDLHWSIAYFLIALFGIFYAFLGNYFVCFSFI